VAQRQRPVPQALPQQMLDPFGQPVLVRPTR
jgi:hypothetical protein